MKPTEQRLQLMKLYPTEKWKAKVNKMDDRQVHAIFMRMKSQNKL